MALLLAAAVLWRESSLAFILASVEALWRAPHDRRRGMAAVFVLTLCACLAALLPVALDRARFPHFLSNLPALGSAPWWDAVAERARGNLPLVPGAMLEQQAYLTLLALALLAPAAALLRPADPRIKRLAAVLLMLASANFAGLAGFYPLQGWAGVRAFVFLAPWIAVLMGGWLVRVRSALTRSLTTGTLLALLGAQSLQATEVLAENRRAEQTRNAAVAGLFERLTEGLPILTVVAFEHPWEIGWRRYPVTVVWGVPDEPEHLANINRVLNIDAVIGRTHRILPLEAASGRGELGVRYERVRRRAEAERQVLVRSELLSSAAGR
jgi:hypothetical protein